MEPITVHATPTIPQIEAAFRQLVLAIGPLLGMIGWSQGEGFVNHLLMYAGPIAAIVSFVWGQVSTHVNSKKASAMAAQLPNAVASFK